MSGFFQVSSICKTDGSTFSSSTYALNGHVFGNPVEVVKDPSAVQGLVVAADSPKHRIDLHNPGPLTALLIPRGLLRRVLCGRNSRISCEIDDLEV